MPMITIITAMGTDITTIITRTIMDTIICAITRMATPV